MTLSGRIDLEGQGQKITKFHVIKMRSPSPIEKSSIRKRIQARKRTMKRSIKFEFLDSNLRELPGNI